MRKSRHDAISPSGTGEGKQKKPEAWISKASQGLRENPVEHLALETCERSSPYFLGKFTSAFTSLICLVCRSQWAERKSSHW